MKRRVFIFLVLQLLFASFVLAGTTGKISGRVMDAETGEPLPGSNVIIENTNQGAATDLDGDYVILNVPPGLYTVKATMMGYEALRQTEVLVSVDRTVTVNFTLKTGVLEGEAVTIVAKKEVVRKDLAGSAVAATSQEVDVVPVVNDIQDFVNLQAGIDGWEIRGGDAKETNFMMNGLMMVDNRANEPIAQPNMSSVKEISILKGGFGAEYGNARSGVVNVITQKGSRSKYHGTIDMRYTPAHYKHRGASLFDEDNYYIYPYLSEDNDVCWLGTSVLPDDVRERYPEFEGWNAFAEGRPGSPEDYRNIFIWERRLPGANELAPEWYDGPTREGSYGDKPDMILDAGFGGPVPGTGGKVTFFGSYRMNREAFALPTYRDYFKDQNGQLKLTWYMGEGKELEIDGLFGETNTMSTNVSGGTRNSYLRSGLGIFQSDLAAGPGDRYSGSLYLPSALAPYDIKRNMIGATFTHTVSPKTFYTLRVNRSYIENNCDNTAYSWRDTTSFVIGGATDYPLDERPYGLITENLGSVDGTMNMGGIQASQIDYSSIETYNVKADLVSQVDKRNEVKAGLEFSYDDIKTHVGSHELYTKSLGFDNIWDAKPIRMAAYIRDKIEFQGMIANIGVRFDYFNPNVDWFTEKYSDYYTVALKEFLEDQAPRKKADSQLKISPRFGISHPISDVAKIFFNYGHFYSLPRTSSLYGIGYGTPINPISFLGNPELDMEKSIKYELGYEHDIAGKYLVSITGYYDDITEQAGGISYVGYDELINYTTYANNNYEDIRGVEVSLRKRYGRWFTGWVNYDYRVKTYGYVGRSANYQDRRQQALSGKYELLETLEDARPVARAMATMHIPTDYGQWLGGWNFSLLFSWRDGPRFTWDPLKLNTPEVRNNVEWKDYYMLDAKFSKTFDIGGYEFEVYGNIENLLDIKYFAPREDIYGIVNRGFADAPDFEAYMKSLHLPLYDDDRYQWEGGNDQPGDVKSSSKDYINMPNRSFLTYTLPRAITIGVRYKFN